MKFVNSAKFMKTSSSNVVDNLTEEILKIKYKDCDCSLEFEGVKNNLIKNKCLSCNNNCSNKIDEELKKNFKRTFNFTFTFLNLMSFKFKNTFHYATKKRCLSL